MQTDAPVASSPTATASTPAGAIRLGTRSSALAIAQATLVADLLRGFGATVELTPIRTQGDADRTSPLSVIGGQGVFTSALQDALLRDEIDMAVHSAKDLPTTGQPGLELAAFLSRQDPRDVLITADGRTLDELPVGATVGTSSGRRVAQLRSVRPDLRVVDLRGNIDTRIRRATEGDLDAVVLAAAGLHRLGWQDRIGSYLPLDRFVPAPSQAALAIEVRAADERVRALVARLDEPDVSTCVLAERAFLRAIGAGCTTPVGAHASVRPDGIELRAMVASADLADARWETARLDTADPAGAAADLARRMLGEVRRARLARRVSAPEWTVLVTRPEEAGSRLATALASAGVRARLAPMIVTRPTGSLEATTRMFQAEEGYFGWVVFTSSAAIDGLLAAVHDPAHLALCLGGTSVAAVGQGTAARLREFGVEVELVPERQDAAGLVAALREAGVDAQSVWLPQGDLARPDLADGLVAAGADVVTTVVYRTEAPAALDAGLRADLLQGEIDAVVFASPSAIDNLRDLLGVDAGVLADLHAVCIGDTTAAAARAAGWSRVSVAATPDDAGLVAATLAALQPTDPSETRTDA